MRSLQEEVGPNKDGHTSDDNALASLSDATPLTESALRVRPPAPGPAVAAVPAKHLDF
jgi:hypothetical protein